MCSRGGRRAPPVLSGPALPGPGLLAAGPRGAPPGVRSRWERRLLAAVADSPDADGSVLTCRIPRVHFLPASTPVESHGSVLLVTLQFLYWVRLGSMWYFRIFFSVLELYWPFSNVKLFLFSGRICIKLE